MKKTYHIVNREEKNADAAMEQFAKANGQLLLPLVELITQARIAVDEVIGVIRPQDDRNRPDAERHGSGR